MIASIKDGYNHVIFYLNLFGCREIQTKSKFAQAFWYFVRYYTITMNAIQFLAMVYQMALTKDLEVLAGTFYYCATHLSAYYKILNLMLHPKRLKLIEEMLASPSFNLATRNQYNILKKSYKFIKILTGLYLSLTSLCIAGFCIVPLIDGKRNLPYPGIFPHLEEYYEVIYVLQVVTILIYGGTNATVDLLSVTLIQAAADQFDILKDKLMRVEQTTDREIEMELRLYVQFHNNIFLFIKMTQDLLSLGFFFQFAGGIIVICFSLLQLLIVPIGPRILIIAVYLFVMVLQVGMYCWFGQKIVVKSQEVIGACYMSEWYNCSTSNKKFFFLIMERAKRPTYITAWKLFPLSLANFVMILKTSYSYFAVFKNVYDS